MTVQYSSSDADPEHLLEDDSDDPETFSDLEQNGNQDFCPDLNFGKTDFCVVKFDMENGPGLKHYGEKSLRSKVNGTNLISCSGLLA